MASEMAKTCPFTPTKISSPFTHPPQRGDPLLPGDSNQGIKHVFVATALVRGKPGGKVGKGQVQDRPPCPTGAKKGGPEHGR